MNKFRKSAIFLVIIFGLLNLTGQIFFYSDYIHFIETYASSDNHISYPLTIVVGIDLLVFGIAILIYWIDWIDWIDWTDFKFSNVNIIDKIAISIILIFIILYHSKNQSDFLRLLFREDHFFENLTVIFALLTSILLTINLRKFHDHFSRLFLILCSLAFFYFGMEEISWGQNIFKWETPQIIGELNYQNETNTHNYLNPYFTLIYILFNIVLASILLFSKRIKDTLVKYIKTP